MTAAKLDAARIARAARATYPTMPGSVAAERIKALAIAAEALYSGYGEGRYIAIDLSDSMLIAEQFEMEGQHDPSAPRPLSLPGYEVE